MTINQSLSGRPSSADPQQQSAGKSGRPRLAVVAANSYEAIVQQAVRGFEQRFAVLQPGSSIDHHQVGGAFELPLRVSMLAGTDEYDALIACALVVDDSMYRHDFLASAVFDGLMRVQLETRVPVFPVVLTPRHFHDHADYRQLFSAQLLHCGQEAAAACNDLLQMQGFTPAAAQRTVTVPGVWTVRGS